MIRLMGALAAMGMCMGVSVGCGDDSSGPADVRADDGGADDRADTAAEAEADAEPDTVADVEPDGVADTEPDEATDSEPDGSGDAEPDGIGDGDGDAPAGVDFTAAVADYLGADLNGVQVCWLGHTELPCETTVAGQATLHLPADTEVEIELTLTGYVRFVFFTHTDPVASSELWHFLLVTRAQVAMMTSALGATQDWGLGLVVLNTNAHGDTYEGATVAIDPASGDGPHYHDTSGIPSATLTSTSTNGQASYMNVPLGTYQAGATLSATACTPINGVAGARPIEVFATTISSASYDCQ